MRLLVYDFSTKVSLDASSIGLNDSMLLAFANPCERRRLDLDLEAFLFC